MKKPSKPSGIVVSVCVVVVFAVAATMFFLPYMPQPIQDVLTPKPTPATDADGETIPTRPTVDYAYLYTKPSEWFSIGEDVNWNDQLIFRVENIYISKIIPDNVDEMVEVSSRKNGSLFYQEIVDNHEDYIFLEYTVSVTCTALPYGTVLGLPVEEDYNSITQGHSMMITYYNRQTGELQKGQHDHWLVANLHLSGNEPERGRYELDVGESVCFRSLRIISKEMWEENDVLITPRYGGYSSEQLNLLGFSQPHILLNEKA